MEYKTEWVKDLPETCPECGRATIDNSFKSKKGEMWKSVKCDDCGIKWIQTKPKSSGNSGNAVVLEEIQAGFKELNERLDNMGKFLAEILKKNE